MIIQDFVKIYNFQGVHNINSSPVEERMSAFSKRTAFLGAFILGTTYAFKANRSDSLSKLFFATGHILLISGFYLYGITPNKVLEKLEGKALLDYFQTKLDQASSLFDFETLNVSNFVSYFNLNPKDFVDFINNEKVPNSLKNKIFLQIDESLHQYFIQEEIKRCETEISNKNTNINKAFVVQCYFLKGYIPPFEQIDEALQLINKVLHLSKSMPGDQQPEVKEELNQLRNYHSQLFKNVKVYIQRQSHNGNIRCEETNISMALSLLVMSPPDKKSCINTLNPMEKHLNNLFLLYGKDSAYRTAYENNQKKLLAEFTQAQMNQPEYLRLAKKLEILTSRSS